MSTPESRAHIMRELARRSLLLPSEAAYAVHRSKRTINRWIANGLPTYEVDDSPFRYVKLGEVRAWIITEDTKTRRVRRN